MSENDAPKTQLELYVKMLLKTVSYFTGLRVIFYSEVALFMFSITDFTFHATQLGIILKMSGRNYAYSHAAMSRADSYMNYSFWNEVFLLLLVLFLLESVIRVYYILKLAYHHKQKVKDGDLCCMTCHSVLMSAAMTTEVVAPHILSAIGLIVYFIYSNVNIAAQTTQLYKDYFAESPFVTKTDRDTAHQLAESFYYEMGKHVIDVLQDCRLNASRMTADDSIHQLLTTGKLLAVVEYDCAKVALHCKYSSYYLQLSIESMQSLINYTVIRALFGHVINMHQYEVYNQQTRLQARGSGSRLIRVYKVRHMRTQRKSRPSVMELPRRALMSLVSLGTNVASRFRSSRELLTHRLHIVPKDTPEDSADGEQLLSVETAESCLTGAEGNLSEGAGEGEQPAAGGARLQPQLHNRRSAANPRKVNYEHLKVSDLYPGTLELASTAEQQRQKQQQTTESRNPTANQISGGGNPQLGSSQQQQQQQQQQDRQPPEKKQEEERPEVEQPLTEKDIDRTSAEDGFSITAAIRRKLKTKRINDSIFTDETFYSLESA